MEAGKRKRVLQGFTDSEEEMVVEARELLKDYNAVQSPGARVRQPTAPRITGEEFDDTGTPDISSDEESVVPYVPEVQSSSERCFK